MIDLSATLQAAIYANLSAHVTLAPVFGVIPENTQPPVVLIGEDSVDPTLGGKGGGFESHSVRIVSIVAGPSKVKLFAIMHQVKVAMLEIALAAAGAEFSTPVLTGSDDRASGDGVTLIGEQHFQIFAQPAD